MTLKQLISDMNSLENKGINSLVDNKSQIVYLSLTLIIGDNLDLYFHFRVFRIIYGKYSICRYCKCSKTEYDF